MCRARAAPGRRTPRRFANKVVPSRQMKPYRFSLLRDLHQRPAKSGAGLHGGGSRSVPSPSIAPGPRPTQSAITTLALYNSASAPFPLCAATSLVSYAISTCSLFPCHLLRFFACHIKALAFTRSCEHALNATPNPRYARLLYISVYVETAIYNLSARLFIYAHF